MKDFENRLKNLFDYQRFEKNKELQRIINGVLDRHDSSAVLLTDSQLSFAAGGKVMDRNLEKKNEDDDKKPFDGSNL